MPDRDPLRRFCNQKRSDLVHANDGQHELNSMVQHGFAVCRAIRLECEGIEELDALELLLDGSLRGVEAFFGLDKQPDLLVELEDLKAQRIGVHVPPMRT